MAPSKKQRLKYVRAKWLHWVPDWDTDHHFCHKIRLNLSLTEYRKGLSLSGCYDKTNFCCNCKSSKFNLVAIQPGKKPDFVAVILYQKGQQLYFNDTQLKEPNSHLLFTSARKNLPKINRNNDRMRSHLKF